MKDMGKNLELVFCSSDRDEASFKDYFKEMPWLALPFSDKRKTALSRRFDVQGMSFGRWHLDSEKGQSASCKFSC